MMCSVALNCNQRQSQVLHDMHLRGRTVAQLHDYI